ncbi:MAG: hypothetical protein AMS26_22675 [Bacteroides sp. SM23_62]|nr:MAG: hypothetical protein AMS26_22675 [Bacteroides sp. SM23_62]
MNYTRLKFCAVCLCAFCLTGLQAQETASATGGDASGSGGRVSFTVGQVVFLTHTAASGTVTQGVQQPFEILVVTGFKEARDISLECKVYPNPAAEFVLLEVQNYDLKDLNLQLYDMNGKILQHKKVEGNLTPIYMGALPPATYFLKIRTGSKELQTFIITKN